MRIDRFSFYAEYVGFIHGFSDIPTPLFSDIRSANEEVYRSSTPETKISIHILGFPFTVFANIVPSSIHAPILPSYALIRFLIETFDANTFSGTSALSMDILIKLSSRIPIKY